MGCGETRSIVSKRREPMGVVNNVAGYCGGVSVSVDVWSSYNQLENSLVQCTYLRPDPQ